MSSETKKAIKFFLLPDYEKEEKYLTEMHRSGWRLKKVSGFTYTFEKCENENVVYRLDFAGENNKDMQAYISMFAEYGWDYLQDVNGYSYLRKNADVISDDDTEIFSDSESRLEMIKKIINTKLFPIWLLFIGIVIPQFSRAVSLGFDILPFHIAFTAIWSCIFVLYTYILIHCHMGFARLKKKYRRE
jgi:hypothetical protein